MSQTSEPSIRNIVVGEATGTFILVFFGVGSVMAAVATGAQAGLWQVAVVWAVGVSLAIYTSAGLSGAHLNPAITLVATVYDRLALGRSALYIAAQMLGAIAAALVLYAMFAGAIAQFEVTHAITRGAPGSEISAMMFGEYFPNPAIFGTGEAALAVISPFGAFVAEAIGTAVLAFVVGTVTSGKNMTRPAEAFAPVMIGLTVAALISLIAPLTQGAFNPARDLGPRLISFALGWGEIAIPGPRGGWLGVYVAGPIIGALIGGGLQRLVHR